LIGGSADLAGSNKSLIEAGDAGHFASDQYGGRNFHFGVREHAMAAFCNGMALTGIRAYGATFFIFTDYLRPAMRLSAIMRLPVLYILTHDSIGLGEDGPTHQPVEHLAACRAIPNLLVMRPADANEVSQCYVAALSETRRPTALILTRQNVPTFDRRVYGDVAGVLRGGYVLKDCEATPDVILIGTGSEVSVCVQASSELEESGIRTRVVSMPCWELFEEQTSSYKQQVLPDEVRCRVAVEAGVQHGWEKFLGPGGRFVGMRSFGASAPFDQLYEHFGITAGRVVETARDAMLANE
jgi:transketolase